MRHKAFLYFTALAACVACGTTAETGDDELGTSPLHPAPTDEPQDAAPPDHILPTDDACTYPEDTNDDIHRPGSPPYAKCSGCHPSLFITEEDVGKVPECEVPEGTPFAGDWVGRYEASVMPCGACDNRGYRCEIGILPVCDFDGDGPEASEQSSEFLDQWLCECSDGAWNCRIWYASGASCQPPEPLR